MNRFLLEISYNGTGYSGWQIQPNKTTIQGDLQKAISIILGSDIKLVGAGRTDTGVHAIKSFAHFDFNKKIDFKKTQHKLNSFLSKNITIHNIYSVDPVFHARYSALSRTYEYWINFKKDPFLISRSFYHIRPIDLNLFNEGCSYIIGEKDFSSFCKTSSEVKSKICNVTDAFCFSSEDKFIFKIKANRFLHNMVRSIVGTLIDFSLSKINKKEMLEIILSKDRSKAGYSVPSCGLYLVNVEYPKNSFYE